jgi:hypothetical protein
VVEAITAAYAQEDDDWAITVDGLGKRLTARAPGIIAARDRVDQLVEDLVAGSRTRTTVVHLLGGSALDFTSAYITARLARPGPPAGRVEAGPSTTDVEARTPAADASATREKPTSPLAASKQLPSEITPGLTASTATTEGHPVTAPEQRTDSTAGGAVPLAKATIPPARG